MKIDWDDRFWSKVAQAALARRYGVSQPLVSSVVRRAHWKHVGG